MSQPDYEPNVVLSTTEFDVVGTRPIRHDGADKVTGRALYGADFTMAGLIHGAILRSPHAHARIKSIDTSKAEALAGVKAVVTAQDLADPGDQTVDLGEGVTRLAYILGNVLAREKVLYKGHAIACVAATSPHIAQEAAQLIEVDYELLSPVLTAPAAMELDAPLLHEDMKGKELGEEADRPSNVADHFRYSLGDIDKGFAEADLVVGRSTTRPAFTRATLSRTMQLFSGTTMAVC